MARWLQAHRSRSHYMHSSSQVQDELALTQLLPAGISCPELSIEAAPITCQICRRVAGSLIGGERYQSDAGCTAAKSQGEAHMTRTKPKAQSELHSAHDQKAAQRLITSA